MLWMSVWVQERMNRKNAGHESQLFSPVSYQTAEPVQTWLFIVFQFAFVALAETAIYSAFTCTSMVHTLNLYICSVHISCFDEIDCPDCIIDLEANPYPTYFFCFIIYTMQEWITYYNKSDCWLERQSTFLIQINDYT